ncbi:MAG: hypothetical protein HWD58_21370 [Bacteroidota bacterium]|nr:MAG: hypothetical protein HWD58_21370 [Bacteroidota bacterium]
MLSVSNPKADLPNIQKDTASVTKNTEWIKLVKKILTSVKQAMLLPIG